VNCASSSFTISTRTAADTTTCVDRGRQVAGQQDVCASIKSSFGPFGRCHRTLARAHWPKGPKKQLDIKSCGPDAPTLASSLRMMICKRRWLSSPVHRGATVLK
jgi:hypothetical protein